MASYRGAYRYTRMGGGQVYAATRRDGPSSYYVGYAHRTPGGWRYSHDGEHVVGPAYPTRDSAVTNGRANNPGGV